MRYDAINGRLGSPQSSYLASVLPAYGLRNGFLSVPFEERDSMLIYGHRGAAGLAPENTIESILTALRLGVDGIEIDVRRSSDGVPVVIHDATLERTTNGQGPVGQRTFAELQVLRTGSVGRIPSLQEVLDVIADSCALNVELKETEVAEAAAHLIGEATRQKGLFAARVVVSSFLPEALQRVRQVDDRLELALLTRGLPTRSYWRSLKLLRAVGANIDLASVNGDFVQQVHAQGLRVMVFTVNSQSEADRMRQMGVDGIFSDFPDRVHP